MPKTNLVESMLAGESIAGPRGFLAGGITAGIKPSGKPDLAMIASDTPAVAAAVTTKNLFSSAPVLLCRARLQESPRARGVLVNAGVANACTGAPGLRDAEAMATMAEKATQADAGEFLVASTGVIGKRLPMDVIRAGVPKLAAQLRPDGWGDFARSIMTTDLVPKLSRQTVRIGSALRRGPVATVLGICKGSGMIHPNMATMLAFIVTDYPLGAGQARQMLRRVTEQSFNCLTVDGDTSTSDTLLLLANGAACNRREVNAASDARFEAALLEVAQDLTRQIARDGEGATRLVTVEVAGARDEAGARQIAISIAKSSLVKTALFGHDPNWGRICCAAGYAGVSFDIDKFSLKLQGKTVMKRGLPVAFDRAALAQALDTKDVLVQVKLGEGSAEARVWTCDLTYDYVKINAEYTT